MAGRRSKDMSGFETIQEIVLKAHRLLPPDLWDHISGGAESETTLKRNRHALDRIAFRPRVLRDVTTIDMSTAFLGRRLRIPVFFAPLGGMNQFHPEGGLPCLRAASKFGTMTFLSSVSQLDLGVAANTEKETLVFQLYVRGDDAWVDDQIRLVKESGCRAFCLTVDTAIYSRRERDLFNRYAPPGRRGKPREGFQYQAGITWKMVDRFRNKLHMPIILKGISTAEDALLAVEHGIDVVYVSNHGGRQLDHCRGSIDVLPEIFDAVGERTEIVVDGGFLRGTDVIKAIALGARAVGIGKLQAWALAAAGEEGLTRMLEILETEIGAAMALLGVTALDQLDTNYLHPEAAVNLPDELSPFPTVERLLRE